VYPTPPITCLAAFMCVPITAHEVIHPTRLRRGLLHSACHVDRLAARHAARGAIRAKCGAPRTPRPPAFETAAASSGPAATFIPAKRIGCWIPNNLVSGVMSRSPLSSGCIRMWVRRSWGKRTCERGALARVACTCAQKPGATGAPPSQWDMSAGASLEPRGTAKDRATNRNLAGVPATPECLLSRLRVPLAHAVYSRARIGTYIFRGGSCHAVPAHKSGPFVGEQKYLRGLVSTVLGGKTFYNSAFITKENLGFHHLPKALFRGRPSRAIYMRSCCVHRPVLFLGFIAKNAANFRLL
jgi:hypothetical protein